jgi:hypothetical protein
MLNQIEQIPPVRWSMRHPRLAAWIVLAAGMCILLLIAARDVGLLPTQWVALLVAATLVAGLCVWIISWEDEDEADVVESERARPEMSVDDESSDDDTSA